MLKVITSLLLYLSLLHLAVAQDAGAKFPLRYAEVGAGLQVQEAPVFTRWGPSLSFGLTAMDEDRRRGRFLTVQVSGSDRASDETFSLRADTATCVFCFRDTTSQVDLQSLAAQVTIGRIVPLKTWGDRHRLSLIPAIGYAYQHTDITYLDDATDRLDTESHSHGVVSSMGLQYRYHFSDRFFASANLQLLALSLRVERTKPEMSDQTSTLLDFDGSVGGHAFVGIGMRL